MDRLTRRALKTVAAVSGFSAETSVEIRVDELRKLGDLAKYCEDAQRICIRAQHDLIDANTKILELMQKVEAAEMETFGQNMAVRR